MSIRRRGCPKDFLLFWTASFSLECVTRHTPGDGLPRRFNDHPVSKIGDFMHFDKKASTTTRMAQLLGNPTG
jgi:hypothetical protein